MTKASSVGVGEQNRRFADPEQVCRDFDRIARLPDAGWDHNAAYHDLLLQHVPRGARRGLDLGCGKGEFARLLATRCQDVLAIDLAPGMIAEARSRTPAPSPIRYEVTDFRDIELSQGEFDVVTAIASLHHLELADALDRIGEILRPGGRLVVLDLYAGVFPSDTLLSALAMPVSAVLRWRKTRHLRPSAETRAAWDEHAKHDRFLTFRQVKAVYRSRLPGSRVRRHLLWRYSAIWTKP